MELSLLWILLAAFLLTTAFFLLYQYVKFSTGKEGALALSLKGGATICCFLIALYGAIQAPDSGHILIASGLLISALADVLLGWRFYLGMLCFALAHVCYGAGYVLFSPPGWQSLLCFLVCLAGIALLIPWAKKKMGDTGILPFAAYGIVLSAMLSLAITQRPLLLIGAALFVASDLLLGRRIALNIIQKGYDYLCLGCYYLAQFLIAASMLF